jgi:hypothetical protein
VCQTGITTADVAKRLQVRLLLDLWANNVGGSGSAILDCALRLFSAGLWSAQPHHVVAC